MKETLKSKAYRELCDKILNLEYPPNTLLSEEQICQDLGINRTPVREAIINLQQDKLVTVLPKKGLLITPITLTTVDNFFEIRLLIEPYLISHYGSNAKSEDLHRLHQQFLALDSQSCSMADEVNMDKVFHSYIWSLNQNEMLQQLFKQMFFQNHRIGLIVGKSVYRRMSDSKNEHLEIILAFESGDFERTNQLLIQHLNNAWESAKKVFSSLPF